MDGHKGHRCALCERHQKLETMYGYQDTRR